MYDDVTDDLTLAMGRMAFIDPQSQADRDKLNDFRERLKKLTQDWREFAAE